MPKRIAKVGDRPSLVDLQAAVPDQRVVAASATAFADQLLQMQRRPRLPLDGSGSSTSTSGNGFPHHQQHIAEPGSTWPTRHSSISVRLPCAVADPSSRSIAARGSLTQSGVRLRGVRVSFRIDQRHERPADHPRGRTQRVRELRTPCRAAGRPRSRRRQQTSHGADQHRRP